MDNVKHTLSSEAHERKQGLRKAVESELYEKYALYYGAKLVGYIMLNETYRMYEPELIGQCELVEI